MDTITHALSGMLLARVRKNKTSRSNQCSNQLSLRARLLAGMGAAAFPDIDFVVRFLGPIDYLNYHRGVTHSILMLPLWAVLLAVLCMLISRRRYSWRAFYTICAMGIGIHILGDVITAYGTMVFAPFSGLKVAFPTTFIIDAYFTGIIVVALLVAFVWRSRGSVVAVFGLATLTAYVGFQAYLHNQAMSVAEAYIQTQGLAAAKRSVMPQPLSPFNWKLVISEGEMYHVAYINLRRKDVLQQKGESESTFSRIDAQYRPLTQIQWRQQHRFGESVEQQTLAKEVWAQQILEDVKRFMLFPALYGIDARDEGTCAWFVDHRFVLDGIRAPFRFGACRKDRVWRLYRLQDKLAIPMLR